MPSPPMPRLFVLALAFDVVAVAVWMSYATRRALAGAHTQCVTRNGRGSVAAPADSTARFRTVDAGVRKPRVPKPLCG